MRTSIYLVRHAQTVANLERRYQSWSDSALTPFGQQQAQAIARRLRRIPFTTLIASPVERSRATSEPMLEVRPSMTQRVDARWAETHHGRWEGLTYREVMTQFASEARERFAAGARGKAEGGESLLETDARVRAAWNDLLRRFRGERLLVATHATPIQLVLCAVFNLPPDQHWHWRIDLGSITCIDVYGGGAIVRMVNEVPLLGR